jgi:hypothetical protein
MTPCFESQEVVRSVLVFFEAALGARVAIADVAQQRCLSPYWANVTRDLD